MTDITYRRTGGRAVELYVPITIGTKTLTTIEIGAVKLGNLLDWRDGKYSSAMEFLARLSGYSEAELRQLCYPDSDRVMAAFFDMLPQDIVADMASGSVPQAVSRPAVDAGEGNLADESLHANQPLDADDGGFGA